MFAKVGFVTLIVVAVMSAEAVNGWATAGSQRDAYDTALTLPENAASGRATSNLSLMWKTESLAR